MLGTHLDFLTILPLNELQPRNPAAPDDTYTLLSHGTQLLLEPSCQCLHAAAECKDGHVRRTQRIC